MFASYPISSKTNGSYISDKMYSAYFLYCRSYENIESKQEYIVFAMQTGNEEKYQYSM